MVFIPKVGKTDYGDPKAYRPITLTSCIFKAMEKVLLGHLGETILKANPLHKRQHAFRRGKGCDTALSAMVNKIKKVYPKRTARTGGLPGHLWRIRQHRYRQSAGRTEGERAGTQTVRLVRSLSLKQDGYLRDKRMPSRDTHCKRHTPGWRTEPPGMESRL